MIRTRVQWFQLLRENEDLLIDRDLLYHALADWNESDRAIAAILEENQNNELKKKAGD